MRAAAIFGPGDVSKYLARFRQAADVEWVPEISPNVQAALIFGGDGTIYRHLSAIAEAKIPVLIVPCGSGNDFARSLGLRKVNDSIAAWRAFLKPGTNLRHVDLGIIRTVEDKNTSETHEHLFCCVAGIGLDARIARRANALPRWFRSHGGYPFSALSEFIGFVPFPMKINVGVQASTFQPTILAAVANTPTYGGGMKVAPQARFDDGKLDVCIVRAMSAFKLCCLFPTVYFGGHLRFREVEYARSEWVRIETEYPIDVYADGEYACRTPVMLGVVPGALQVIAPA